MAFNVNKNVQPYQQGLLSIEQTAKQPQKITSDHVMVSATIEGGLKILSWNVLETKKDSGYAGSENDRVETEIEKETRHQRIVEALVTAIKEQQPDFIALQELFNQCQELKENGLTQKITARLTEEFGDKFKFTARGKQPVRNLEDLMSSCPVIYNSQRFKEVVMEDKRQFLKQGFKQVTADIFLFEERNNPQKKVHLCSAHMGFSLDPQRHENNINSFLNRPQNKNEIAIVAGDFNCSTGPLDQEKRNITTSIAPTFFRDKEHPNVTDIESLRQRNNLENDDKIEEEINQLKKTVPNQGAFAIDNIFFQKGGNNGKPRQAKIKLLDPLTGKAIQHNHDIDLDNNIPDWQHKEIHQHRQIMMIDANYTEKAYFANETQTIIDYQTHLRQQFSDNSIVVRPAKNLFNDTKMGITFGKAIGEEINAFLSISDNYAQLSYHHFYEYGKDRYMLISADFENPELLEKLLSDFILCKNKSPSLIQLITNIDNLNKKDSTLCKNRATSFVQLITNIERLREKDYITNYFSEGLNQLQQHLISVLNDNAWDKHHDVILNHFALMTQEILDKGTFMTLDEVQQSHNNLLKKLTKLEPMGPKARAGWGIVATIFCAAIGFILGAAFGALGGGFGAIPGAIAGLISGFNVAATVTGSACFTAGVIGSTYGFFSGKKAVNAYEQSTKNDMDQIEQVFEQLTPS